MIDVRFYGERESPAVVLLHGGPGAPGEMAPVARRLQQRYFIIEPLQRHSGALPLTVAQHVADLDEVVAAHAGDHPVAVVGASWGAMLGLTYAARHPDAVERLVLVGCGTFDERTRAVYQRRMSERMTPEVRDRIRELQRALAATDDAERRDALFGRFGALSVRLQQVAPLSDELDLVSVDERGYHETWTDALRLQQVGIQPAEFAHITAPVVMLHGHDDPHPGRLVRDSLRTHVRALAYHEFSRCGHLPWLERDARETFFDALECALDGRPIARAGDDVPEGT